MNCTICLPTEHHPAYEERVLLLMEGRCEGCDKETILARHEVEEYFCEECQCCMPILKSKDRQINIEQYRRIELKCGHIIDIDYERV